MKNVYLKYGLVALGFLGMSYGAYYIWDKVIYQTIYMKSVTVAEASQIMQNVK
jgi:hypothetical protein